jgi:hypothetical protein
MVSITAANPTMEPSWDWVSSIEGFTGFWRFFVAVGGLVPGWGAT